MTEFFEGRVGPKATGIPDELWERDVILEAARAAVELLQLFRADPQRGTEVCVFTMKRAMDLGYRMGLVETSGNGATGFGEGTTIETEEDDTNG